MQRENFVQVADQTNLNYQRQHPRYSIDVGVTVLVTNENGASTCCYGRGTEISEGGMAIYIAHDFEIGETVKIKLTLSCSSKPIDCPAVVRNRSSYRYGVEFVGLDASDRKFLSLMCRGLSLVQ